MTPPTPTPDYNAMSPGEFYNAMDMDAQKWTDAFMQMWGNRLQEIDHGLMLGWFANAIMKTHDIVKAENTPTAAPRAVEPSDAGLVRAVQIAFNDADEAGYNLEKCWDEAIKAAQAPLLERIKELQFNLRECTAHADLGWSKYDAAQQEIERLRRALGMAETEMRYAGWSEYDSENVGRVEAYKAAQQALRDKAGA